MRRAAPLFVLLVSLAACGGPKAKDPSAGPVASATTTSGPGGKDGPPQDAPAAPRKACNDAGCTPCGEGLCPDGFYCVKGKGAQTPGCAWRPECVQTPTCACVKPTGCACEDKNGVAQVTCG